MIEVFSNAKKFQAKQDRSSYVAVVVLDEVGLAEDSPNRPLKALHPLLEDGTEGASSEHKRFTDEVIHCAEVLPSGVIGPSTDSDSISSVPFRLLKSVDSLRALGN